MPRFDRKDLMWVASLIAAGAILHGVAIFNSFYFDDLYILRENAWLHGVAPPAGWFGTFWFDSHQLFPGYRPILMLTFYVNGLLFGPTAASYRTVNIALHVLNSLWVAILFRQIQTKKSGDWLPWVVGLLFLLHPLQTLGINFIWKRSELIAATFALTQLILHIQARQRDRYPISLMAIQVLLFSTALFIKESALLIPVYLLIADVIFFKGSVIWQGLRDRTLYACLLGVGFAFYYLRFDYVESRIAMERFVLPNWHTWEVWEYFKVSLGVIPRYVQLWLLPAPRLIDDLRPVQEFPWGDAIATLLLLLVSILLSVRLRKSKWVAFTCAIFWTTLLPSTSVIPLFLPMDQIRMYIPLVGLCGSLALALQWACAQGSRILSPKWIFPLVIGVYVTHTTYQNHRYSIPARIWQDVVEEYETSDIGWASLGQELAASKLHRSATLAFLMAAKNEKRNSGYQVLAYYNMLHSGVPAERVKEWLSKTIVFNLALPDTVNLSVLLQELGETQGAQLVIKDLIRRYPNYAPAHLRLAKIYENLGKNEAAFGEYEETLRWMPSDAEAQQGMKRLIEIKNSVELE